MESITLRLGKPGKRGTAAIYLRYYRQGKQFDINLGERIKPSEWDAKRERVRKRQDQEELNSYLGQMVERAKRAARQARIDQVSLSQAALKKALYGTAKVVNISDHFEQWLQERGQHVGVQTRRIYATVLSNLRDFEAKTGAQGLEAIDADWDWAFKQHLAASGNINKTINKKFRTFTSFMIWAEERDLCPPRCRRALTKLPEAENEAPALLLEEVRRLEQLELTGWRDKVRDILLLQVHTGLRFSDVIRLDAGRHIAGDLLEIVTKKTDTLVVVPLLEPVRTILSKRDGKAPAMTNQKLNQMLKALFKEAGFDRQITYRYGVLHEVKEEWHPLHELISSHTGRRTFATLARARGMDLDLLADLMGHSSKEMTRQYDKSTLQQRALQAAKVFRDGE
jgi:integrase